MAKQIVFYSTSIFDKFEPNIEIVIYSIEPIFTLGFMFKILGRKQLMVSSRLQQYISGCTFAHIHSEGLNC